MDQQLLSGNPAWETAESGTHTFLEQGELCPGLSGTEEVPRLGEFPCQNLEGPGQTRMCRPLWERRRTFVFKSFHLGPKT